jgi:exopolysaccharide biosynthesis polyprenyl glycosylphosphotransferase
MTEKRKLLLTLLKLADLGVVATCLAVAVAMTSGGLDVRSWLEILEIRIQVHNFLFVAAYIGLWHVVLRSRGLYGSYRLSAAARELRDLGTAVLVAVAPLAAFGQLLRFEYTTPAFLIVFASLSFSALGAERRLLRTIGRRVRQYGRNLRNVIIVGTGTDALEVAARLARREDLGYHVLAVIEYSPDGNGSHGGGASQAILERVEDLIDQRSVDEVFITLPLDSAPLLMQSLVASCEEQGVTVRMMAHVASLHWANATADTIEGQPVFTLHTGPPDAVGLITKRLIDIVGAASGLVIFVPMFLAVAVVIKLTSAGPVFFAQERVGFNRRRFRALKFRTMVAAAEQMQAGLESSNEAEGPIFKIENDPRITGVGKWLRHLSIDELPQLVNVLKGDMSLVGPRPLPLRDVSRIDVRWHKRRFSVKPGITCLWQVNSREPKFDEWIRQDMEYIDNWSLGLDLWILARTIPAVLSGHGAH